MSNGSQLGEKKDNEDTRDNSLRYPAPDAATLRLIIMWRTFLRRSPTTDALSTLADKFVQRQHAAGEVI